MKRLFFYGTLRDTEILGLVLSRRVYMAELKPARLHGFVPVFCKDSQSPTLIPQDNESTTGVLYNIKERRELTQLINYEGDEYYLKNVSVMVESEEIWAGCFFAYPKYLKPSNIPWCYNQFQKNIKSDFLESVFGIR